MPKNRDLDLLEEYDFSKGICGRYAQWYREGTNIVKFDDDVAAMFPNAKSVNDALRALERIIDQHEEPTEPTTNKFCVPRIHELTSLVDNA